MTGEHPNPSPDPMMTARANLLDAVAGVLAYDYSDCDSDVIEAIDRLQKAAEDYGTVQRLTPPEPGSAIPAVGPQDAPTGPRHRTSKDQGIYEDGELWSFIRRCMSQGKDIHLYHEHRTYEEYSARLDAAAIERLPELKAYIVRAVVSERTRAPETGAPLTNEQCQRVKAALEEQEWTGISNDDVRMWAGFIDAARSAQETSPSHTAEDDFQHWLSYSGKRGQNEEDLRLAYFAGADTAPAPKASSATYEEASSQALLRAAEAQGIPVNGTGDQP